VSLWSARMSDAITYRPMQEADLEAVHDANMRAFLDLDRRLGHEYAGPLPDLESAFIRLRRLLGSDPGGAWVAEREGEIAGAALALLREGLWGLSLLFVDPPAQGHGAGRELLARAHAYGRGARGFVILSSSDPWAMRAYARLGLTMHPSVSAQGTPRVADPPSEVREGGPEDLPLTVEVDRAVRGAAHGDDVLAMLEAGNRLLVAPGRGYAILRGNEARLVAAFDDAGARLLLRGALARLGDGAFVQWITATQQWALHECLDAGLALDTNAGCVFLGGDVGPFRPYLPTGSYL
jgi:GNAT superfamily N-acetyltransferase